MKATEEAFRRRQGLQGGLREKRSAAERAFPWGRAGRGHLASILAFLFLAGVLHASAAASKEPKQKTFGTPEAAVQAFVDAVRQFQRAEIMKILGPRGEEVISSGDEVADRLARERFLSGYDEKHTVAKRNPSFAELIIGNANWPFPIPLIKTGKRWRFDTDRGVEELLNRRIGRNELGTLDVLDAYVQAQREYFLLDRDQDDVWEYAQQVRSSPGKRDGLFWPVSKGETPSPMGALFAKAGAEGYEAKDEKPAPYHGYRFKVLTAQGPDAPGGSFSYVVNGNMVAGYAMVAWPSQYGNSGIMTFIVNSNGTIWEKNLGEKTGEVAAAMNVYNPDDSWRRAK